MDARNFLFMFYGFAAAWLIILVYVATLGRRGERLKKELEDVKRLVMSNQTSSGKMSAEQRGRETQIR